MLATMAGASLTRRQRRARVLLAAPLGTVAGCLALWAMHSNRAIADRIGWPWWLVALLAGAVVVGPVFIAAEALNSRILRAAGLPPFRTQLSAARGESGTAPARGDD